VRHLLFFYDIFGVLRISDRINLDPSVRNKSRKCLIWSLADCVTQSGSIEIELNKMKHFSNSTMLYGYHNKLQLNTSIK
jgi:hypothetical protein